jgi:hypothetical protein
MPNEEAPFDIMVDILEMLPPEIEGVEKRKHSLTRDDLILIGRMIDAKGKHTVCTQFTQDEIAIGRKLIGWFNGASTLIGSAILLAIIGALIGFTAKGFWTSLLTNKGPSP